MKQLRTFGDERELAFCAYCGGDTGTRDHSPSRVFLDEPYPENLPVVPACRQCNTSFSADEEYVACLLSAVLAGTTDPSAIDRGKIRRILTDKPALRARIDAARFERNGSIVFEPEQNRVHAVFTKLAQGHALFELHSPCSEPPDSIRITPLLAMSPEECHEFENPPMASLLPEVGSRSLQRLLTEGGLVGHPWLEVQAGRYRFHASIEDGVSVRVVIHEHLAGHVQWWE